MTTAHSANGKAAIIGDRKRKPTIAPVDKSAIHDGLHSFDRWTNWRYEWRGNKWTKPPVYGLTGEHGSSTDRGSWVSFSEVFAQHRPGADGLGIGFVLGEDDCGIHFSGIDLDDCRNAGTGELSDVARDIIATMDTYAEISPSRTGVKLLCIGAIPPGARTKNKAGTVEIYSSGRYFTLTGQRIEGAPKRVEQRQEQLTAVWQKYIGSEQVKPEPASTADNSNGHATESALAAMLRIRPDENESDGSKRLFAVCCRAVEHDLDDESAVEAVREYEAVHPFPRAYSDDEILARVRDAERRVERGSAVVIANYHAVEVEDDDGETKTVNVPRSMSEIIELVNERMNNWPRRVDNMLFVDDPQHGLNFFDRQGAAALFGWLRRHCKVAWAKGSNLVSETQLFKELERTAARYSAIESMPHEPTIRGVYYRGKTPKPGEGSRLRMLLDKFRPETTIDRDLIQAAFMTAFWGGPPGARPAFVVTSDAGRGVGKSQIPQLVGHLCGGAIDARPTEDINKIITRMLSPGARTKRIAILDNVKTLRFSWAELEGMITGTTIGGHQMYVGDGERPNLLTWFITLNGVSMATDMSQRSVIIKVVRGKNEGTWLEKSREFIDQHRNEIIGDIIAALRAKPSPLEEFTRWATWEQHVLCRLPDPSEAQRVILERQGEANCEQEEAEIIEDYFANQLWKLGYHWQTCQVRIPNEVAARWYCWATNDKAKTTAVTRKLKQLSSEGQLKRIAPDPSRSYGRCFIWTGSAADVVGEPIANDLSERIAQMMEAKDD
jgi:hypothetical protein